MKKFVLVVPKPRNPYVGAACFRHAGAHRRGAGSLRQTARKGLRHELERLESGRYSP